jgi:hypothetical protein
LHGLVGCHRYEFYLEKKETCTTLGGPFWYYFLRAHHLEVDDVVTFKLPSDDDTDEEDSADDTDEEHSEELDYEEEINADVFEVTVTNPDGEIKPYDMRDGMFMLSICYSFHYNNWFFNTWI